MLKDIDVISILNGQSDLNVFFDNARLIDLDSHTEYKCEEVSVVPTSKKCYCIWHGETPCRNCISHRANKENKQMTKLQYVDDKVQLIMATPVIFNNKKYILEVIKDITNTLVVNDENHPENTDIHNIINELNEVVVKDPFTNLYNKKYIEKQIQEDLAQFRRTQKSYVIAIFDIDRFKWVNDTYGHIYGDLAIQDVVNVIHKHTDSLNCWAARYGGDEFLLAFRNISYDDVDNCCRKIVDEIKSKVYEVDSDRYFITSSYGLYQVKHGIDTYESIIKNADVEMYRHKKGK